MANSSSEELLTIFKSYLERFDYPNINFLDEEETVDLFTPANRQSMLIWIMQNLSSSTVLPSDWLSAKEIIADYLHDSGFCESKYKHLFVACDTTLPSNEEMRIFQRIFEFMIMIKHKIVSSRTATKYNLEALINADLNIFPGSGVQKLLSPSKMQEKINAYRQNIAELEKINAEFNNTDMNFNCHSLQSNLDNLKQIDIADFHSKAINLQELASSLNKVIEKQANEELHGFDVNIGKSLKTCAEESIQVIKYLKHLNIVFPSNSEVETFGGNDEMSDLIKRIDHLSTSTAKLIQSDVHKI